MANYTLHLGFNWNGPRIGTLFSESGPSFDRFLQFALADNDDSDRPAWFRFEPGDSFRIKVHDLSSGLMLTNPRLFIAFGPVIQPQNGQLATYDPTTIVQSIDSSELVTTEVKGQRVLFIEGGSGAPGGSSPWGPAQYTWTLSPGMQLLDFPDPFEMGFSLHILNGAEDRYFASDPEVIVGSGGEVA